jgi:hypothetical protein
MAIRYRSRRGRSRRRFGSSSSSRFNKKRNNRNGFSSLRRNVAMNEIAVYKNPFSSATAIPKIPDGSVNQSYGVRLQNVQNVIQAVGEEMLIYIFPGLLNGCLIVGSTDPDFSNYATVGNFAAAAGAAGSLTAGATIDFLPAPAVPPVAWGPGPAMPDVPYAAGVLSKAFETGSIVNSLYTRHLEFPEDYFEVATQTSFNVYTDDPVPVKKWRIVSQGTRINLTSNYDSNEGWFECYRTAITTSDFQITKARIPPADRKAAIATVPTIMPNWNFINFMVFPNRRLLTDLHTTNPTYVAGKLADIGKYLFQLKPINTEHKFNEIKPTNSSLFMDSNFDCIVIKIHGHTHGTNDLPGANLVVQTTTNMEVIYDEEHFCSRLMSGCASDIASLSMAKSVLTGDIKAARVVGNM